MARTMAQLLALLLLVGLGAVWGARPEARPMRLENNPRIIAMCQSLALRFDLKNDCQEPRFNASAAGRMNYLDGRRILRIAHSTLAYQMSLSRAFAEIDVAVRTASDHGGNESTIFIANGLVDAYQLLNSTKLDLERQLGKPAAAFENSPVVARDVRLERAHLLRRAESATEGDKMMRRPGHPVFEMLVETFTEMHLCGGARRQRQRLCDFNYLTRTHLLLEYLAAYVDKRHEMQSASANSTASLLDYIVAASASPATRIVRRMLMISYLSAYAFPEYLERGRFSARTVSLLAALPAAFGPERSNTLLSIEVAARTMFKVQRFAADLYDPDKHRHLMRERLSPHLARDIPTTDDGHQDDIVENWEEFGNPYADWWRDRDE